MQDNGNSQRPIWDFLSKSKTGYLKNIYFIGSSL